MEEIFIEAIGALATQLGLEPPVDIENPVSLSIDDRWLVYVGLFKDKELVMFVGFDPVTDEARLRRILRDNLFSAVQDRPRLGMTPDQRVLIWTQMPILQATGDRMHKALLRLSERVRDFQEWLDAPYEEGEDASASNSGDDQQKSDGAENQGGDPLEGMMSGIRV